MAASRGRRHNIGQRHGAFDIAGLVRDTVEYELVVSSYIAGSGPTPAIAGLSIGSLTDRLPKDLVLLVRQ